MKGRALGRIDLRGASLIATLLLAAALAWVLTANRMSGMDAGPGTDPGSLGFYVSAWTLMMAAMMLPSAAPTVAIYESLRRPRDLCGGLRVAGGGAFAAGYLLAWTLFGLLAYALFELIATAEIDALGWDQGGRLAAAAVLGLAAAYELTPLKHACLSRCRNPVGFLLGHWRDGMAGALRRGLENGAWCIGCCCALMAVLFALGLMSIVWMLVVAAMVAAEKLLPWRRAVAYAVAMVLLVLAAGVAFAPRDVPALTLPDSSQAMAGMEEMEETPGGSAAPISSPMPR